MRARVDRLVLAWSAVLQPQADGGVLVRFPDLPEAVTEGDDENDALAQAADCLAEAIAGRITDREAIPAPSRVAASVPVALEPVLAYKVALYAAMRAGGLSRVGLALRLGIDEKDVRRLLDPRHRGSRLERLIEALAACGVETGVVVLGEGVIGRLFDSPGLRSESVAAPLEPVT
jgi:antitoxin HicB